MSIETQARFAAAVNDRESGVPAGLTAWNGRQSEKRFSVYRNNVAMALTGALASRFPVAETIVGTEFFAAMALEFVRRNPPRSPLLLAYGDDFAGFVEIFEPASELVYLPDVIRLEAARGKAYHAEDRVTLNGADLSAVAPERLTDVMFEPHPSLSILRSAHPVVTIWAMNSGEIELAPVADWSGEDAIVVRPQMIVNIHRLPPGGATLLTALAGGETLGVAIEMATNDTADFDLAANLVGALQAGAFTAIR